MISNCNLTINVEQGNEEYAKVSLDLSQVSGPEGHKAGKGRNGGNWVHESCSREPLVRGR